MKTNVSDRKFPWQVRVIAGILGCSIFAGLLYYGFHNPFPQYTTIAGIIGVGLALFAVGLINGIALDIEYPNERNKSKD
jgi:uncharacterized membrane protein HdeD (DUF308 family)